jgi:hypothetical protein
MYRPSLAILPFLARHNVDCEILKRVSNSASESPDCSIRLKNLGSCSDALMLAFLHKSA